MNIETTPLDGVYILTPEIFEDHRGYFLESYNKSKVKELFNSEFVQDNESKSQKGVLRGLHFQQPPFAQEKLIRVIRGSIQDVIVDIRSKSPTFGKSFHYILSEENKKQIFVPIGFAHGFLVLENDTIINYKCSEYYTPLSEESLLWNDDDLAIEWASNNPILSKKDQNAQKFATFVTKF